MPARCGLMKLTGKKILPGLLALLLAGCGQNYAPLNPLASSIAPATASCPDLFSFEPPQTLAAWSAPTWPGGLIGYSIDNTVAHCGNYSMRIDMKISAGANTTVEIADYFQQLDPMTSDPFSGWIYFPSTPPASLKLNAVFLDSGLNWKVYASPSSGYVAGWNHLTANVTIASPGCAAFLLDFQMLSGTYTGSVWIDELNW
jgi:hypothetical protein